MAANRAGKCGRKQKKIPRTDGKIVQMALKGRTSCRNFSIAMAVQGVSLAGRTVKYRLLERGLKAYHLRKKPLLTQPMIKARLAWAKNHVQWTFEQWKKVKMIYLAIQFNCGT